MAATNEVPTGMQWLGEARGWSAALLEGGWASGRSTEADGDVDGFDVADADVMRE